MNNQSINIIPGIFETEFSTISNKIYQVAAFVDWIHIDMADGKLVPNYSVLNPALFAPVISQVKKRFELHMMVKDPLAIAEEWVRVGFQRLLVHIEGVSQHSNIIDEISQIKSNHQNLEVGLAIDKETSVDSIFPYLDTLDCILVMTIKAGFSGQKFIPELLDKVRVIHQRKPTLPIEVDGGINYDTAKQAIETGATRLVSTSYLYSSKNIQEAIKQLQG